MDAAAQSLDTSKSKADAALVELYQLLAKRNAPTAGSFTSLSVDERREYFRVARQRSRARARAAAGAGALDPSSGNVRDALADAALMILATDAPGASLVLEILAKVFRERPGVPMLVQQRAKVGKMRPKRVVLS
ncbi:hypothetical protein LB572_03040 [Mesorhizobium sp. BH1-1-5]|uniref:hypothetical protein n=1 Tax=Mesorhizobium sp. BH1-1-5 TaxID=2876661 RepID=UPI001CCAA178|nr:hypothetical protein [Mesorhizobium sp. BH1-1-5]MBZ9986068.1 hypothetical protein [Mesorhizobium sp. BH1-1-5]